MVDDFLTMPLSIVYLSANGLPDISTNVQNVNTITHINFLIMRKLKGLKLLCRWFSAGQSINALQNIISLLRFEIIGSFLHFFFKSHTAA